MLSSTFVARRATETLAKETNAVPAVSVCRLSAKHDETLMGLTSLMTSWQNDMAQYCADGYANKAAEMAAWIAVGWSVYREELLAMG